MNRIKEIDGLRAFAVLAVVVSHYTLFANILPISWYYCKPLIAALGTQGVSVFFVISGFVITTLLLNEGTQSGTISLRAFYWRRFFRIIPAYAFYLFIVIILQYFNIVIIDGKHILQSVFFLGAILPPISSAWLVGHTWSLSVEEWFYLAFPLLLLFNLRNQRKLVVVVFAFYAVCCVSLKTSELFDAQGIFSQLHILYLFRYIIVGVTISLTGIAFRLGTWSIWLPLLTESLMLAIRLFPAHNRKLGFIFEAVEPALCGLLVIWFMNNQGRCRYLRWKLVQWVGLLSYSIYLWQQLFTAEPNIYTHYKLSQHWWSPIAIVGCASVSYYFIEKPSISFGRRFTKTLANQSRANSEVSSRTALDIQRP